jgi:hypothetical protein
MNLKKFTQKNADGSSVTYEFDVPKMQGIPDHPGEPKGTDTVPAWLTPGEFVVNAEATRMFEPQIEAMNEAGRAVQRAQGGTIPEYHNDGGIAGVDDDRSMNLRMADLVEQFGVSGVKDKINYIKEVDPNFNTTRLEKSLSLFEDQVSQPQQTIDDFDRIPEAPDLGFYAQMPPVDNTSEIVKDALGNQQFFLNERYNDEGRQQPPVPSSLGTDLNVPNPDELSPMNVPSSFKDNLGFDFDDILNFMQSGNTAEVNQRQRNTDINDTGAGSVEPVDGNGFFSNILDFMKAGNTPGVNQRQRNVDLTGTGQSMSVEDGEVTKKTLPTIDTITQMESLMGNDQANAEADQISEEKAIQMGIDYINEIQNMPSNKQASSGDVGDIYTNSFADKAEGFLTSVKNFFTENFSDLIDSDKLMNAALLYVGSRALGHSHAGSLNFVGRTYLGEIQKKLKVADQAALSNKYTKESVEKYRDTGKVEDLELKQNIQLEGTESMVDRQTGRTIVVNKYKDANTGKVTYQTPDGQTVDMSKGRLISQSDETARSKRFIEPTAAAYEAELKRLPEDIQAEFRQKLPSGQSIGLEAYDKARELNLDESKIASIVPSIFRQMRREVGEDSINETAFSAYLDKQLVNLSLDDYGIKSNFDKVPAKTVDLINSKIKQNVPNTSSLVGLSEFYRKAHDEFKGLTDKQKSKYKDKVTEGMTPFLVFVEMELEELAKGN